MTGSLPVCQIAEECKNNAIAICRARYLCKQRGCGLRTCAKHVSHAAKGSQANCFDCSIASKKKKTTIA